MAAAMARERLYQCNKCGHKWWEPVDASHDVLCPSPNCNHEMGYARKSTATNSHLGIASRAAEITSQMLELDYGIPPSMQVDNAREGDSYVKMPPLPKAMPMPQYMARGGGGKEVVHNFLATAKASGGIGPNYSMNGLDVVGAAKASGGIADPRKTAQFYGTKDK